MSLRFFATENFTTVLAGILMACPVAGFRPIRAFRLTTLNFPRPASGTSPPFFIVLSTMEVKPSKKVFAAFFSVPHSFAIASTRSVRVILLTRRLLHEKGRVRVKKPRSCTIFHVPDQGAGEVFWMSLLARRQRSRRGEVTPSLSLFER